MDNSKLWIVVLAAVVIAVGVGISQPNKSDPKPDPKPDVDITDTREMARKVGAKVLLRMAETLEDAAEKDLDTREELRVWMAETSKERRDKACKPLNAIFDETDFGDDLDAEQIEAAKGIRDLVELLE